MNFKNILVLILVAIVSLTFVACGFTPLKQNPNKDALVSSNGGYSVVKGDYLYFINGFTAVADIKSSSNKYNEVTRGALCRITLNEDGSVPLKVIEADKDDEDAVDETVIDDKSIKTVVPKILGYEAGSFFIYDNYIVYATPNDLKDKSGTIQTSLIDFYRCKIDGSKVTKLFSTKAEYTNVTYSVKKVGNKTYLLVLDGKNLYKVDVASKDKTLLDTNVTGAKWEQLSKYDATKSYNSQFDKTVYYTKAGESSGNILKSVDLVSNEIKELANDNITTYTLVDVKNNQVFYKKTNASITDSLYSNSLTPNFAQGESDVIFANSYTNYYILDAQVGGYEGGVVVSGDNGTYYRQNANSEIVEVSTEAHQVVASTFDIIYTRKASNGIYKFDLSQSTIESVEILSDSETTKVDGTKYVDLVGNYMTYLGEFTNESDAKVYYTKIIDLCFDADNSETAENYTLAKFAKGDEQDSDDEE